MDRVLLYDDRQQAPRDAERLAPLVDLRPSFDVRTGALTTAERVAALADRIEMVFLGGVAPHDLPEQEPGAPRLDPAAIGDAPVLCVNGRCLGPFTELVDLEAPTVVEDARTGVLAAAALTGPEATAFLRDGTLPPDAARLRIDLHVLDQPWDVVRFRSATLDFDLGLLLDRPTTELPQGVIAIADDLCRFAPDSLVYPGVVIDAQNGPVIIDDDAVVRPGAVLVGPLYVGRGAQVLDRALVKGHTAIGPESKVAGEVGGTIIQGWSNKAHDGHLGDAWLGSWVNLGAGTTNSNLLNTYGEVVARALPDGPRVQTGMQFLGCVLGDHVKTAICTRLMTGTVLGTGTMHAASVLRRRSSTARFTWHSDSMTTHYRIDRFLDVARTVMARRGIDMLDAYAERLRALCTTWDQHVVDWRRCRRCTSSMATRSSSARTTRFGRR